MKQYGNATIVQNIDCSICHVRMPRRSERLVFAGVNTQGADCSFVCVNQNDDDIAAVLLWKKDRRHQLFFTDGTYNYRVAIFTYNREKASETAISYVEYMCNHGNRGVKPPPCTRWPVALHN